MRKFIVGAAAAAMVAGSSVAQAAPVAIDSARSSSIGEAEELNGAGGTHLLLGLLAAGLLAVILWQVNEDGEDVDLPVSP